MAAGRQTPQAMKVLQGTNQKLADHVVQVPKGWPAQPKTLSKGAIPIWHEICQVLHDMQVLAVSDQYAIESLAENLDYVRRLRSELAKADSMTMQVKAQGIFIIKPRPEVTMIKGADVAVMQWATKLGLTPTDRGKLTKVDSGDDNPFGQLAS